MRHGLAVPIAIALASLASAPGSARAAACCGTGFGTGLRLAPVERTAISFALRAQDLRGTWDASGRYVPSSGGAIDREYRAELRALTKIGSSLQLGAILPWVHTYKRFPPESSDGGGPGDVVAFARWDFVPVGGRGAWPGIAATLGVGAPTGRATHRSRDLLGADVTGIGAWEIRPGVAIEKSWWTGWTVLANASIGVRLPYERENGSQVSLGPRAQVLAAGGRSWTFGLGVLAGILYEYETAPAIDGVRAENASRARTAALANASWEIDDNWQPFGSVQIDLPVNGLGRNELVSWAAAIGLRRVWNVYD